MSQFSAERFARGVKLTIQHVDDPLASIALAASDAQIEGTVETMIPTVVSYTIPIMDAQCDTNCTPNIAGLLPLIIPPFQQQFDRVNLQVPDYPVLLSAISISVDQRASTFAVVGIASEQAPYNSTSDPGDLAAVDMGERYSMTIRLLEKTPWVVSGDVLQTAEVLKIEIDGASTFGLGTNPILLQDLSVRIQPYKTYWWEISTPGLKPANLLTEEALSFVSFTLAATLTSPLTTRDLLDTPIQNMPLDHGGVASGTTIPYSPPVAGQPITGDDVQAELNAFDATLRDRLDAGYAVGTGTLANIPLAAAPFPHEMLSKDSGLQVIAVPLYQALLYPSVQIKDYYADPVANLALLPYVNAGHTTSAFDRAFIRVPDNFVLHHAFASIGYYSPPSDWPNHSGAPYDGFGTRTAIPEYIQKIGVVLSTWLDSDLCADQQVAYVEIPGGSTAHLVDRIDLRVQVTGFSYQVPGYDLVEIPLVWDASRPDNSWMDSGPPFFMGTSSNKTASRSQCGAQPFYMGLSPNRPEPYTKGQERLLEIRWQKNDAVHGLYGGGDPTDTRVGQLGEWVILVGKQTLGA